MGDQSLAVEIRTETGKGVARRLRAIGRIPAVLYSGGKSSISLSVHAKELDHLLKTSHAGVNTLIDLQGNSSVAGKVVLVKELQRHSVAGTLSHADFFEIDRTEKIQVQVPIKLIGTPAGVKLGGVLEHITREIELECLPTSIPDSIDFDISEMQMGDSIHVSDLVLPKDVELKDDGALPVAHVAIPKLEVEETTEAAAEGSAEAADGETAAPEGSDDEKSKDS